MPNVNYNNPIALAKLTSDPIFGTGEPPEEHKFGIGKRIIVQYPDPDEQGLDEDIITTKGNLQSSQKYWKHTWKYNTSSDMPNFAIPGKPQYAGENRTNVKLFGKWHIPFTTDGKPEAKPAVIAAPDAKEPVVVTDLGKTVNAARAANAPKPTSA